MSAFLIQCPKCGVALEADDQYIGVQVACCDCDYHFILEKSSNVQIDLKDGENLISLADIDTPLVYTKPLRLFIENNEYSLSYWKDVLKILVSWFLTTTPDKLNALINVAFSKFSKRVCLQSAPDKLATATQISENLWIETNFSARDIIRLSKEIAELCDFDPESVKIVYLPQETARAQARKEQKIQEMPEVELPEEEKQIDDECQFVKKLDWSFLTSGITIPVKNHQKFLDHLSQDLSTGKSINVSLIFESQRFVVSMGNVAFTKSTRTVIQFRWSKNSPIAQALQNKFSVVYSALVKNRQNKDALTENLTISCGKNKDEFIISIPGTIDSEEQIPQTKTVPETDSNFSVFSNFDFTYSVLKKLYADNFEFDADAKDLQTLQWCQHNLNLRLPLLRKLRAFESAEDYRETFALLEGSSEWMICQLQDNLNRSGFLTWASENGFALSDIAEMLEVKIAPEQDAVPETQDVQSEALKRNSISDAELLIGAVSSLYKRQLLTGHLFSDFQAIYYCLQNFGITKPIICRHYPYMREEDFGKDYQFWADGPQELPYLILHNCSGLKHEKLLSFVQDLGLPLEELANDLNCELSFFETTPASPSEPEEQEVIQSEQDQDEPVIQTFISNDEIDRMLLEFVTNTPGQKRDDIINHLAEKEIPEQRAETRLRRHSKVFCIADQYYSAEGIYGFDEAADVIWGSLNDLFEQNNGYTSAKELYRAVSGKLDDFFYDNDAFDSEVEIYQLAQYLFEKEQYQENTFVFLNKIHIWRERPDYPTGDSGLLIHWAKGNKGLLTTNVAYANFLRRGVAEGSKTAIFSLAMDKVYDRFWMIDPSTFLLKDDIQITESQLKEIKVALDNLYDAFDYNFIPMWDIAEDWFDSLPRIIAGQSWTPMLLQSVLRDYSEQLQYRTIPRIEHRQQHAAVVEVNSVSKDYSDLVYSALKAEFKTPSIKISRNDLFDLLIRIGLWPEDVSPSYGSAFQNLFKDNFHFHVPDKNTVEVG